jgi:hypothetical protein
VPLIFKFQKPSSARKVIFCCREKEVREAYDRRIEKADLESGKE